MGSPDREVRAVVTYIGIQKMKIKVISRYKFLRLKRRILQKTEFMQYLFAKSKDTIYITDPAIMTEAVSLPV